MLPRILVVMWCGLCCANVAMAQLVMAEEQQQLALANGGARGTMRVVPDDAELESSHARIGRIDVRVDDVFESDRQLATPYRLANGLHISTRIATVYAQLLFRSGDEFSRRVLDETARLLRSQRYLNDATVEPVRYNDDNTVDLEVRVHDVWTFSPGASFGRKGGQNRSNVEIEDTNLFGLGKQVSLSQSNDFDRTAWHVSYTDPNVLGSWWRLSGAYANASDGGEKVLTLARPFYSLDSRWSFGGAFADATTGVTRYSLGRVVDQFKMQRHAFDIGGGISSGLQEGWTRRYLGGVRYDEREFSAYAEQPSASIPDRRTVAYPWIGVEWIQDEYLKTRNLDQIGRTEDMYLGRAARIEVGTAGTIFGATRNALVLSGSLHVGEQFGATQYWVNSLAVQGRVGDGGIRNGLAELRSKFYQRQSPHSVLFASAHAALSSHLDPEDQLALGGDNGLRGYPLRYQAGTSRALLTVEERFYSNWQPFKLVNVGAAAFFDAGRTWGRDTAAPESLGWLRDVGFGLRLGNARSGLGNVLHIDLAFPLDGRSDIDSMQVLIETRRSF